MVAERGRALLIAVNKWDGIPTDKRDEIRTGLDLRLPFLDFAPMHFISALHGTGVGELMRGVSHAYDASMREMPTPELTRVLETAISSTSRRWCAAAASSCAMRTRADAIRRSSSCTATRCSTSRTRTGAISRTCSARHFRLEGTPVRVEFRSDENPFKGKRNPLTPRQVRSRQRMLKRVKRVGIVLACRSSDMGAMAHCASDYTAVAYPESASTMAAARKILKLERPFAMRRGGALPGVEIAYETWGDPSFCHDNAILIFTGLSPSAHAASSTEDPAPGWWEDMIGPGRPIDTRRFFVICVNSLGSPFGSTSPASINPATGSRIG